MPYNKGASKAMSAMQKEYGSNWKSVYYALANKRAGKGLKGKHRGHTSANKAFAKGSHWGGKGKSRRGGSKKSGHRVSVSTRGRANVTHRSGGAHIHVRVH